MSFRPWQQITQINSKLSDLFFLYPLSLSFMNVNRVKITLKSIDASHALSFKLLSVTYETLNF